MTSSALPPGLHAAPRSALVISLRFLGDALLATPLAHAVRQRWPDCAVDMLVFDSAAGMLAGNPDLRAVRTTPERATRRRTLADLRALWRRYDLALIAQTGTRPHLFGFAAAPVRIGLAARGQGGWKRQLLTAAAESDPAAPRVLDNHRLAALIGIADAPQVVPPQGAGGAALAPLLGFDPRHTAYAVVHPSPRWRYKQWTDGGWRALLAELQQQGLQVVVTGGPGDAERQYLDRVLGGLVTLAAPAAPATVEPLAARDAARLLRLDGRLSLAQTADLLRGARLYVGPDTATTHLAAACGTPTLALYGPTDTRIWGPWPVRDGAPWARVAAAQRCGNVQLLQNAELACVPCQLEGCGRRRDSASECLDSLPARPVLAAARRLLHGS